MSIFTEDLESYKIEQLENEIVRLKAELRAWKLLNIKISTKHSIRDYIEGLKETIDLTYKAHCGRDLMHMELHKAVGEVIKIREADAYRAGFYDGVTRGRL